MNALLHHVASKAAVLAGELGNTTAAQQYVEAAGAIKVAVNAHLWDQEKGAFMNDPSQYKTLYPQDGNALAVWFNLTQSSEDAERVSDYLVSNWGQFGSSSPEWNGNIGTFPGSMEVHAHFAAGRADRALGLIRLQWGHMLNYPYSTNSTFWEGYLKDGTFGYQPARGYMSNAHGWATGPGAALSQNTLGVRPLGLGGSHFAVVPSPGGLPSAQGRFRFTMSHAVDVSWSAPSGHLGRAEINVNLQEADPKSTMEVGLQVPQGMLATLQGTSSRRLAGYLDGRQQWCISHEELDQKFYSRPDVAPGRRVWFSLQVAKLREQVTVSLEVI